MSPHYALHGLIFHFRRVTAITSCADRTGPGPAVWMGCEKVVCPAKAIAVFLQPQKRGTPVLPGCLYHSALLRWPQEGCDC